LNYSEPEFVDRPAHIDGFNALFASVEGNRPDCIGVLKEYGVSLSQTTAADNQILPGATPLHLAAYYGRTEAARKLIELGANINALDINGQTPLHVAVFQGQLSIITLLRASKADLSIRDKLGVTAASYCREQADIREALVARTLDPLMRFARGSVPKAEEKDVCDVIAKHAGVLGCVHPSQVLDVSAADGTTPLIQAVMHSNFAAVKVLLDAGVLPQVRSNRGLSAALYAHWISNPRIKVDCSALCCAPCTALCMLLCVPARVPCALHVSVALTTARLSGVVCLGPG
jgi:hypothetical protein